MSGSELLWEGGPLRSQTIHGLISGHHLLSLDPQLS